MSEPSKDQPPLSVGELNRLARRLLERGIEPLWVEGEVSNLARPASGHVYFSLKDSGAQIRCAWFRQRQRSRADELANGEQMLVFGRVSLYEPRGDYQLIVDQIEALGEGRLRRQIERLKKKLAAEGLFDQGLKRELPSLPRRIGVITSPSGAAIRDVLSVLKRRFPAVPVIVYPAAVQGQQAPAELTNALAKASARNECDVLIIGRGGGSLEDLMAFNDEAVARAIHASPIPIVSAVGHEVDVTISDFVADRRAPTPSGAAEIVVPEQAEWQNALDKTGQRLVRAVRRMIDDQQQNLDWVVRQLGALNPARKLREQRLKLAALLRSLKASLKHNLLRHRWELDRLETRLKAGSPQARLKQLSLRAATSRRRLPAAAASALQRSAVRLELAERRLQAISPLATLERGYSVITTRDTGALVARAEDVGVGTEVVARLAHGLLSATVTDTATGDDDA